MFAGNFAPRGFAFCDGQLLSISSYSALFALFGTTYGGDGRTTFGLPDLRGRIPIHQGTGPGLSQRRLGAKSGAEAATLSVNQLPSHSHTLQASSDAADLSGPEGAVLAESGLVDLYADAPTDTDGASGAITAVGGGQPHTNVMPFQCLSFIVALVGIFPSRS